MLGIAAVPARRAACRDLLTDFDTSQLTGKYSPADYPHRVSNASSQGTRCRRGQRPAIRITSVIQALTRRNKFHCGLSPGTAHCRGPDHERSLSMFRVSKHGCPEILRSLRDTSRTRYLSAWRRSINSGNILSGFITDDGVTALQSSSISAASSTGRGQSRSVRLIRRGRRPPRITVGISRYRQVPAITVATLVVTDVSKKCQDGEKHICLSYQQATAPAVSCLPPAGTATE